MCRPARLKVCRCGTVFSSNSFNPPSQRAVGMKNSNQRSEEWRSAVSSQQSARKRSRSGDRSYKKSRQPSVSVRKRSRSGDRSYSQRAAGSRDREIAPTVSNLDGSNLSLLGFSLFRSRRFQRRGRGGRDRTLRRGCR